MSEDNSVIDDDGGPNWVGIVCWTVAILFASTLIIMWSLGLGPFVAQKETEIMRQSNQYRTSAETMLTDSMQSWQDLDTKALQYKDSPDIVAGYRAQQKMLIRRMNTEVGHLKPDQVPADVKAFLDQHGDL